VNTSVCLGRPGSSSSLGILDLLANGLEKRHRDFTWQERCSCRLPPGRDSGGVVWHIEEGEVKDRKVMDVPPQFEGVLMKGLLAKSEVLSAHELFENLKNRRTNWIWSYHRETALAQKGV